MTLRLRTFLTPLLLSPLGAGAEQSIDFNRDIRPILSNSCIACHGPDEAERKAKLRFDLRDSAVSDLGGYHAIVPGDAELSELIARVEEEDEDERMPPKGKGARLTDREIKLLKQWIKEGAKYDRHWSYAVPKRPTPPEVKKDDWAQNKIDHFILAKLERKGLTPSAQADRWTLARRAAIDLTGLPPTLEEAKAFVDDPAPDAYHKYVDRLLEKPAYGEHWARLWLDLARYADSAGYADDPPRTIWGYRDWVIKAINDNMPFDQFSIEQLAGDLLEKPTNEQLVATAFHRNTLTNNEGGTNDEEFRNVAIVDRVNTTMQTWMGTTMACAQCHTHKYDPITQNEYFQFFAFFNNTEDADRRNEAPLTNVFTEQQRMQKLKWLEESASLKAELTIDSPELAKEQQKWEKALSIPIVWDRILTDSVKATNGVELSNDGGWIKATGGNPAKSTYTVEFPVIKKLEALRLETLPVDGKVGRKDNVVISRVAATILPTKEAKGVKGRFVRIDLPGANKFLHVAEVQVFAGGSNVARNGKASQKSTGFNGPAHLAIDGNTNGDFNTAKSTTHTAEGNDPWWEVDLGSSQEIDKIVIWNRTDGDDTISKRIAGYKVTVLDKDRKTVWNQTPKGVPAPKTDLAASGARPLKFVAASADFEQKGFPASAVLNDKLDPAKGWGVAPKLDKRHELLLLPEKGLPAGGGTLRLTIVQESKYPQTTMAKFRVTTTSDSGVGSRIKMPHPVRQALASLSRTAEETTTIADYYRSIAPATAALQKKLQEIDKRLASLKPATTVPIMRDRASNQKRKTNVQIRGNYKEKAEEVSEGVPAALHPLPKDAPRNRLTLARWIMSAENPLTARVIANRQWEALFGTGLVATSEEFGSQGEYPSHPQLLDWLAVELRAGGWDMKQFHKLIVTSATYQQSSRMTPELLEADPFNLLLTRGPRVRLSAEMIRDQALAVSGLLSSKMYGPPSRPPRPKLGLRAAFGGSTDWADSKGEDRYRRGLYTEWRRSMPYPSMATFDAPNREVCTVKRSLTNTPLQALVTLNDPVYLEAAQALARRSLKEAPKQEAADIVEHMLRLALIRPVKEPEINHLTAFHKTAYRLLLGDAAAAKSMATEPIGPADEGADIVDLAAWTAVANIVLNLDEIFQKP